MPKRKRVAKSKRVAKPRGFAKLKRVGGKLPEERRFTTDEAQWVLHLWGYKQVAQDGYHELWMKRKRVFLLSRNGQKSPHYFRDALWSLPREPEIKYAETEPEFYEPFD